MKLSPNDFDRILIDLYRWSWNIEADLHNAYIDRLNAFLSRSNHNLIDYIEIYESELKLKHFKQFSKDLFKIIFGM